MIVSWMTTNRCNLKCAHCYQDADECDSRELSTEEARTMISQIARAGFKIMIFSGGEPLMRDDIFRARRARRIVRPAPGVRQQRHAHHARNRAQTQRGGRLRHGH